MPTSSTPPRTTACSWTTQVRPRNDRLRIPIVLQPLRLQLLVRGRQSSRHPDDQCALQLLLVRHRNGLQGHATRSRTITRPPRPRFELEPEITAKLLRLGYRIFEVPITYTARSREEGKKLTAMDGVKASDASSLPRLETPALIAILGSLDPPGRGSTEMVAAEGGALSERRSEGSRPTRRRCVSLKRHRPRAPDDRRTRP